VSDVPFDPLEDAIRRGNAAERLFNDPLLVEAFQLVSADLTGRWATSDPADTAGRERLYLELQVVAKVRENLRAVVTTGKMAKAELQRRTLLQKARDALPQGLRDFI
jgi:hypothetical protein